MQLLICPDSETHREESALAPYAAELRRMYELFSHGATFDFSHQIRDAQLLEYLASWLAGRPDRGRTLGVTGVTRGGIHEWQERFTVTVGGLDAEDWPEQLRESRERTASEMARLHERWRQEEDFDFERAYRRELASFGDMLIRLHVQAVERQVRILTGEEPYDFEALMPSSATSLVLEIHRRLREGGSRRRTLAADSRVLLFPDTRHGPIPTDLRHVVRRDGSEGGNRRPGAPSQPRHDQRCNDCGRCPPLLRRDMGRQ
jgi:hypothetical protein